MPAVGPRDTFTRESILEKMRAQIAVGTPIVGAGCSAGIIAKFAERGGADLIICYSTGRSRLMGLPTTPIGDSNPETMKMYAEIANVVDHTPIIGGAAAGDPQYRRLNRLVEDFKATGYDGIINFPSIGTRPDYSSRREHVGQGIGQEFELIRLAREAGMLTLGYAYHEEHARGLAAAGVDIQVPHAGWTTGGEIGADPTIARGREKAADLVQKIIEVTWQENPDAICLAHGGSIAEPEDTQWLYENTDAQGFVGASSIERIPVERAVQKTLEDLKAATLPEKNRR